MMKLIQAVILSSVVTGVASAAAPTCDPGRGVVTTRGPEPLTTQLRNVAAARDDLLFRQGQFDEELFVYVGCVAVGELCWHVVYLSTTWGQSCRATHRLLVYQEDLAYVGQYSNFSLEPVGIEGSAVIFGDGSRISFGESGPPAKVFLNGDLLEFSS